MLEKYIEQEIARESRKSAAMKPVLVTRIIILLSATALLIGGILPAGANDPDCGNGDQKLEEINRDIAKEENIRDDDAKQFFEQVLSDNLIFRRANETVIGKDEFIKDLEEKNEFTRTAEDITVTRCGDRALVTLIVRTEQDDGTQKRYRNIRVFSLVNGRWQLESWYNYDLTNP